MDLGLFSLSLAVKNIEVSKEFYEALGFEAMTSCGSSPLPQLSRSPFVAQARQRECSHRVTKAKNT